MLKSTLLIAAMSTAVLVTAAEARGPGDFGAGGFGPNAPDFTQLDADGDGQLTQAEITSGMQALGAERFAEADANGDGALDADEIVAMTQQRAAERMIAQLDTDEDGLLSQEELQARMAERMEGAEERQAQLFARVDTNEDGTISQQEYDTALAFMQNMGPRGDRDGGMRGDHRPGGPRGNN